MIRRIDYFHRVVTNPGLLYAFVEEVRPPVLSADIELESYLTHLDRFRDAMSEPPRFIPYQPDDELVGNVLSREMSLHDDWQGSRSAWVNWYTDMSDRVWEILGDAELLCQLSESFAAMIERLEDSTSRSTTRVRNDTWERMQARVDFADRTGDNRQILDDARRGQPVRPPWMPWMPSPPWQPPIRPYPIVDPPVDLPPQPPVSILGYTDRATATGPQVGEALRDI